MSRKPLTKGEKIIKNNPTGQSALLCHGVGLKSPKFTGQFIKKLFRSGTGNIKHMGYIPKKRKGRTSQQCIFSNRLLLHYHLDH